MSFNVIKIGLNKWKITKESYTFGPDQLLLMSINFYPFQVTLAICWLCTCEFVSVLYLCTHLDKISEGGVHSEYDSGQRQ